MDQKTYETALPGVQPHPSPSAAVKRLGWSQYLSKLEHSKFGASCSIAANRLAFVMWRLANPGGSFAGFYAWQITQKLDSGRAHRTLGKRRFDQESICGETALHDRISFTQRKPSTVLDHLYQLGLQPHHRVVDYGCGSLRLGNQLISYLDPNCYRGLDVTDRFYIDGLEMIDPRTLSAKRPLCQVIAQQTLGDMRAERPDFVVSLAVLKHVPPDCLDDYFDKICSLVNRDTTLVISFSTSETEKQISGKSWSHSVSRVRQHILERCPDANVEVTLSKPQDSRNGVELTRTIVTSRNGAFKRPAA